MKKIALFILINVGQFVYFSQESIAQDNVLRDQNGQIKSVEFSRNSERFSDAKAFFDQYLKLTPKDIFKQVPHKEKRSDERHERYDQYFDGIKVEGAGYTFHFINGKLTFAQGHFVKIEDIKTTLGISIKDAAWALSKYLGIPTDSVTNYKGELIIIEIGLNQHEDFSLTTPKLVYRVYLYADHPNNQEVGFIDAASGEVLATEPKYIDAAATGSFATRYSGSRQAITESASGSFQLEDLTRGAPITTWNLNGSTNPVFRVHITDNDNNWTAAEHASTENDMGLDIHWGLQQIYDHLNSYGINSFDDNGFGINAHIHFGNTSALKDNAKWDPDENALFFGDGDVLFRPIASLDVVAHEFGHGITDFQMGWPLSGNGLVFHEGVSDIWGAVFEYRIKGASTDNWRIGEQITLNKSTLRNIQNTNDPGAKDVMSDTYQSSQYNSGNYYVRSGVFSHWFYILVNGESGTNDLGNNYNVTGIGMDKAEDIMLNAVFNNYLDFTGSYPDVRTAMINVAIAKYCNSSIEVAAVTNAWHAVGVGALYTGSVPSITGNDPICMSQNFTVQNQIAGTTIFWSSGNTSQMTVSPQSSATTTATRANSYNGAVNLNLTLVGSGGCSTTLSRAVQVGAFNSGQVTVTGQAAVCPGNNYTYTANVTGGHRVGYTYAWTKPANWTVNSQIANTISYYVPLYSPNHGPLRVSVNNGCGASSQTGITTYPGSGCGGGYYFSVFPNPSSTTMTVELVREATNTDTTSIDNSLTDVEYSVELVNDSGRKILSAQSINRIVSIDAEKYPKGLYFLHITLKNEVITERVLIK